jgi:hypothetical protein
VPLRSVEAATRDDAIAAAREQFGPSARVVGVRRVRSGGVLGFFATERYVAEVAPDLTNRPAVPATPTTAADDVPADFSSPLASAAPARARAAAPARNGAAAWAAEAVRSSDAPPAASSARTPAPAARSAVPSWSATPVHPAAVTPAKRPADDDRVSELASLLAAKQAASDTPPYARSTFPRASFPRTGRDLDDAPAAAPVSPAAPAARDADKRVIPADVPDAPSPFTAALARMVAGDREVQQAVEEALVRPGAARPGAVAEPRPSRPGRTAQSSVPSPPARQEEETVGDQVIAPSTSSTRTVEVPTWAAEPEVATTSVSSREEAIAEVLRSALAQGHSDEALAGILRKVLAGASPQTALTTPDAAMPQVVLQDNVLQDAAAEVAAPPVVVPEPTVTFAVPEVAASEAVTVESAVPEFVAAVESPAPEVVVPDVVMPEPAAPVFETPVFEAPMFEAPAFEAPANEAPVFQVPVFETRTEPTGLFASATPTWTPTPAWVAAPAASMWGPPSMSATLWGEPTTPAAPSSTPIWAEVSSSEPLTASIAAEPVEASLFEERVETIADEAIAEETPAPEAIEAEDNSAEAIDAEDIPVEVIVAEVTLHEAPIEDAVAEAVADAIENAAIENASIEDAAAEIVTDSVVEESAVDEVTDEVVEAVAEELAPLLARTASDPAPMMSFDSTTVMPPLSLLPPLPGSRGRGRPPVPPAPSRRSATPPATPTASVSTPEQSAPAAEPVVPAAEDVWAALAAPSPSSFLATVTRLPVAPLMATPELPELSEQLFEPAAPADAVDEPAAPAAVATGGIADRLVELGVPRAVLGATFADDVAEKGTYAALTRALALRLPKAPELPTGAGEVLFVVGPGLETLRTAQTLAASLRLDPDRVLWATRGDLAGLAPESSRVTTVGAAINRRDEAAVAGTMTIVAVDAPLRADAYWTAQMMAVWTPAAVWAVVEATRKPEDLEPWIDGLPQVDALIVQDTDLSADPAAVLRRVDTPVGLVDGVRATPHRWASLLCERLENPQT